MDMVWHFWKAFVVAWYVFLHLGVLRYFIRISNVDNRE
jgi:hypothetical protein